MGDGTKIEWTDATWNPITGCSVVSLGCTNCYAMRLAGTRLAHLPSRAGLTRASKAGPVWTGAVRLNEDWLIQPLTWKRPRMVFVCAHGDLFHESVPDEWIDKVFAVMALAPQHTFQLLTKRAKRMRAWMKSRLEDGAWGAIEHRAKQIAREIGEPIPIGKTLAGVGPFPHVWLGVSCEDQARADERIPGLLATPAAVRWVSAEPLLGAIDLVDGFPKLDWVVAGGESGPGARPMHPDWARGLRDQCAAAGVAFFMKQWGAWLPTASVDGYWHGPEKNRREHPNSDGIAWLADGRICLKDFSVAEHQRRMRDGIAHSSRAVEVDHAALDDFHRSVKNEGREVDNPRGFQWMYRVGKKRADRLLDGVEHNAFPLVAPASSLSGRA